MDAGVAAHQQGKPQGGAHNGVGGGDGQPEKGGYDQPTTATWGRVNEFDI